MDRDQQHLRLLSIFHYTLGGVSFFFALIPIVHFTAGIGLIALGLSPDANDAALPALFAGLFFTVMAGAWISFGLISGAFLITTGRFLATRRHYTFCLVVAGVECTVTPFGTVLGAFTLITLLRDSVRALFAGEQSASQDS